jgi:predicted lipoprotein with Yx(FWY)xxD motif
MTTLTLQTTTLGETLATAAGLTLYVYKPDTPAAGATVAVSTCTGGCLTAWPAYYANPVSVPAGISVADVASFNRGADVMQTTYKGWPVYTYKDDAKAGDIKGNGEGSVWFAVKIPFTPPK